MKLAITEDTAPNINAYDETRWAELADGKSLPVSVSLDLLAALHGRWVPFLHPELGPYPLYDALALYAWHGRHHAAHIEHALRRIA